LLNRIVTTCMHNNTCPFKQKYKSISHYIMDLYILNPDSSFILVQFRTPSLEIAPVMH
jgi:hypothetical protein